MESITIVWKKPSPDKDAISTKKNHFQNPRVPKIIPTKRQETLQNTEPHPTRTVRFNKLLEDQSSTSLPIINHVPKSKTSSATEVQIYDDKQLCSVRAAIATFVIVVLIIIAAGISVGIVFAVIRSPNSSGTGNNSQNSFSTIPSRLLTSSIIIGSQTGPPCSAYTEINDPTRSITYVDSYSPCDNNQLFNTSNGGAWIRFVGTGGTEIPQSSAGINHCGSFLSGWYNGTLPSATNVITNGTVCFETYADECGFSVDVLVVNCPTNFYVYFLPPLTVCNARYCTV